MPGFAMASPDAARAEARPVFLRDELLLEEGVGPNVAERGTGGTGVLGFDPRRQGRRFLLAVLPTDLMDTASE